MNEKFAPLEKVKKQFGISFSEYENRLRIHVPVFVGIPADIINHIEEDETSIKIHTKIFLLSLCKNDCRFHMTIF